MNASTPVLDRADQLPRFVARGGIALSVGLFALWRFDGHFLVRSFGCIMNLLSERCTGTLGSLFAGDPCGPYARHRSVILVGLIGLSIFAGALTRLIIQQRLRLLAAPSAVALAIPAAALGVASGLWSWGYFDLCNKFVQPWQAALGGLGIAAGAWVLGLRFLRRQSKVSLAL